jgi:hypothetical protein
MKLLLYFVLFGIVCGLNHDGVLMQEFDSFTLYDQQYTNRTEFENTSQLSCIGGSAKLGSDLLNIVSCRRLKLNGSSYGWKCESDLPFYLKFGNHSVYCEVYSYNNDTYIFPESCSLEYNLEYNMEYIQTVLVFLNLLMIFLAVCFLISRKYNYNNRKQKKIGPMDKYVIRYQ